MVVDLLAGARPRRLVYSRGKWYLEVMRLVAVSNAIFQPRVQRIEGAEAILSFLSRTEEGRPLLQGSYEILRSESGEESRSYDAVDGEWIPTAVAPSYMKELAQRRQKPQAQAGSISATQLLELRSELMLLRSAYEQLKRRVRELEQRADSGAFAGAPRPGTAPAAPAPVSATPEAVPATPPPPVAPAPAPVEAPPVEEEPHLRLPPVSALSRFIGQALGDDVTLDETERPASWKRSNMDGLYVSRLVDDTGRDVGAMVVDKAGVVCLGGTLLMLPPATIEAQARHPQPTEDTLEATSEILNILTASINSLPGANHVRCEHLQLLDPAALPWLLESTRAVHAQASVGGILCLVAR